jgi:hypothetical protein
VGDSLVIQVMLPEYRLDRLSQGLRALTRELMRAGNERSGGLLGGEFGYGARYDCDVFAMHPYCWCDERECPWCGGCLNEDGFPEPVHSPGCYQTHLEALQQKYGRKGDWGWHVPMGDGRYKAYERAAQTLCARMGLAFPQGWGAHCTCGAQDAYVALLDACQCAFHNPSGAFADAGALPSQGAPHFWHKPSGVRIWWYKYIGRGMEVRALEGASIISAVREAVRYARTVASGVAESTQ